VAPPPRDSGAPATIVAKDPTSVKKKTALSYRAAGVDIDAKERALRRVRELARGASRPEVIGGVGGFGGLFHLTPGRYRDPVLVGSVDGVGTKLKVAIEAGVHDTVGYDLVSHCVNDILVQGAEPLFFMDYVATGALQPAVVVEVIRGIARACREFNCALLGGETAEMPGFYAGGEYDVAGFILGAVERRSLLDGSRVGPGDRLIGLGSDGLHINGYTLARKILFERMGLRIDSRLPGMKRTASEELLRPHRCYRPALAPLLERGWVHALAHVTGGGITDNLPRVLPEGCGAEIDTAAWEVPPIFRVLQREGKVADAEMRRTFNLGIGMIAVVPPDRAGDVVRELKRAGERACEIGRVVSGRRRVTYA
jgi:phosphoribosylformylglycinamidine cyclo-ligase